MALATKQPLQTKPQQQPAPGQAQKPAPVVDPNVQQKPPAMVQGRPLGFQGGVPTVTGAGGRQQQLGPAALASLRRFAVPGGGQQSPPIMAPGQMPSPSDPGMAIRSMAGLGLQAPLMQQSFPRPGQLDQLHGLGVGENPEPGGIDSAISGLRQQLGAVGGAAGGGPLGAQMPPGLGKPTLMPGGDPGSWNANPGTQMKPQMSGLSGLPGLSDQLPAAPTMPPQQPGGNPYLSFLQQRIQQSGMGGRGMAR